MYWYLIGFHGTEWNKHVGVSEYVIYPQISIVIGKTLINADLGMPYFQTKPKLELHPQKMGFNWFNYQFGIWEWVMGFFFKWLGNIWLRYKC